MGLNLIVNVSIDIPLAPKKSAEISMYNGHGITPQSRTADEISTLNDWEYVNEKANGSKGLFYRGLQINDVRFIQSGDGYYYFPQIGMSIKQEDASILEERLGIETSLVGAANGWHKRFDESEYDFLR